MNELVHVFLDEPQTGVWNMAVDEAMLEESLRSGRIFLRLYRWSEPTISLGYFQNVAELRRDPRFANLPSVRRLSGGGAILHHHEQTYSCSLPPSHRLAQQPSQLYEEVHALFVAWLTEWGVPIAARGKTLNREAEPLLCFLREAAPDLVVKGHKVLGSAQRRRRGAVLQHGSLLLQASEHAPELIGLIELLPTFPDTLIFWEEFSLRLARKFGDEAFTVGIPTALRSQAMAIFQERVAADTFDPAI